MRTLLSLLLVSFGATAWTTTAANAHAGHLGELAGHAHWLGLGAAAIAAALAAIVAAQPKHDDDETVEDDETAEEAA